MKYNRLISGAPPVSEIGLGAWQLGVNSGWRGLTESEAQYMIEKALNLGVIFFDTAPNYGLGTSESRLGKGLQAAQREKIVINTKFGHSDSGKINYQAGYIRTSLEGSLKRLKLDYVDSLIIHNPPFEYLDGNKNDHYEILERLKEEGKIRAYGASLDTAEEMNLLMNTTGSEVIEAFYNILHQDAAGAFDLARDKRVGIIAKIPLDSGWLTGKYDTQSRFTDIRSRWTQADIQNRAQLVEKIKQIIGPDMSLPSAALAFCLAQDAVSAVIPGNTSVTQLENNLESVETPLSKEIIDKLKSFYQEEVKALNLPW
jgi:aryl-alcohol dehydrogenase-like predicted oxidoreductase